MDVDKKGVNATNTNKTFFESVIAIKKIIMKLPEISPIRREDKTPGLLLSSKLKYTSPHYYRHQAPNLE